MPHDPCCTRKLGRPNDEELSGEVRARNDSNLRKRGCPAATTLRSDGAP